MGKSCIGEINFDCSKNVRCESRFSAQVGVPSLFSVKKISHEILIYEIKDKFVRVFLCTSILCSESLPAASWAKVIFLHLSVILLTEGGGVPGLVRGGYLVWSLGGCTWSGPGGCTWSGPGGCTWQTPPGPGTPLPG